MLLQPYAKIDVLNEQTMSRFRQSLNSHKCDWMVTEMIDGDHLALYSDAALEIFKASTRKHFLEPGDVYSAWEDTVKLHKPWIDKLSADLKVPVIVYGKIVGGRYSDQSNGVPVKTVTEYCVHNDFVIHDIKVPAGFIAQHELESVCTRNVVTLAPKLFQGKFYEVGAFPENKLSALPFVYDLEINWKNEMKGVVMRPIYDMYMGTNRLIMKKLNRKYIGKKNEPITNITNNVILADIAEYMHNEANKLNLLDLVIRLNDGYRYNEIDKLVGKFVKLVLDKVIYVKYTLLSNKEKNQVNKALNKVAKDKLLAIYRHGEEAA